jgi:PAS domain S-box-containing protein
MASPLLLVISENPRRALALADLAGENLPTWRLGTAAGLEAARAHLQEADVVLLAIQAGGRLAEHVRKLREQSFPLYKPILVVGEESCNPQTLQKALEAGVDDAMCEPVVPEELAARIRILLTVSQLSRDLAALRQREGEYRQAVEQAPVGLCLVDQESVITFASRGLVELAQCRPQQLVGQRVEELLAQEQRQDFPPLLARCRQGLQDVHELVIEQPNGTRRPLLALSRPLLDDAGRFAGCVLAWADVGEQGRSADLPRVAEQLAHDFNNLLTIILGNATLLGRMLANQPEAAAVVNEIVKAGRRAAALNSQFVHLGVDRPAGAPGA